MQNIRKLRVWHEARVLAKSVFTVTKPLSDREFPGLVSQLRRAATSVGANIAEGAAHESPKEFARYLQLALASAAEVEHHVTAASDIGALSLWDSVSIAKDARRLQGMLVLLRRRVLSAPKLPAQPRDADRAPLQKTVHGKPSPSTPSRNPDHSPPRQ